MAAPPPARGHSPIAPRDCSDGATSCYEIVIATAVAFNAVMPPELGQSPPAPTASSPRFMRTVPATRALLNMFVRDVTVPWKLASDSWPSLEITVNCMDATEFPSPAGSVQVMVAEPELGEPSAFPQLSEPVRNEPAIRALATYLPEQRPSVAENDSVWAWPTLSCNPGEIWTTPLEPWQIAKGSGTIAGTTNVPVVAGAPCPLALNADNEQT